MTAQTVTLQVTSFHPGHGGGGALLGRMLSGASDEVMRTLVPSGVLPREPIAGEIWTVTGGAEQRMVFDHKAGREAPVDHIIARKAAPAELQGRAIKQWLASNPTIKGVGEGYAERLWDAYGPSLYEIIRKRDLASLARVLDFPKAAAIVDAFGLLNDEIVTLRELDCFNLDGRTARAAISLFGRDAGRRFRENPYVLTLLEPWHKVDAAARSAGVSHDDPRRLLSSVEVALSQAWRASGHTVVGREKLIRAVARLVGPQASDLVVSALDKAAASGDIKEIRGGEYQGRAAWHIERQIEHCVAERIKLSPKAYDRAVVEVVIAEIEQADGIRFEPEQRQAVHLALSNSISAIAGGAGTGKTTIVKAIMRAAIRMRKGEYLQIALSGRAAKRLSEATGRSAMTIYRYLKEIEHGRFTPERGLLVIDEFSMVSTPDFWKLLALTPYGIDMLLVGDPGQLPPIQAGNPADAVFSSSAMPQVKLRVPHRQKAGNAIPSFAGDVRSGKWREPPKFDFRKPHRPGVYLLPCPNSDVLARTLAVFEALTGPPPAQADKRLISRLHEADVQILSMTKAVALSIGTSIEHSWMKAQPPIHNWGLRAGSKLLWTRNLYDHASRFHIEPISLMNGALGVIQCATPTGAKVLFDDGALTEIQSGHLASVQHGWAITVHKAQGSAFRQVVIPVTRSRLLDRAMLYTAITRAKVSAVLIGEPEVIANAACAPPMVLRRSQALNLSSR